MSSIESIKKKVEELEKEVGNADEKYLIAGFVLNIGNGNGFMFGNTYDNLKVEGMTRFLMNKLRHGSKVEQEVAKAISYGIALAHKDMQDEILSQYGNFQQKEN